MLAQRGSGWPQSQQQAFPGMARTFCRALSPFRDLSLDSPPESRLPVDVDDFLSSFWCDRGQKYLKKDDGWFIYVMFIWLPLNKQLSFSICLLPHCRLPCRGRRWQCCSGQPWSRLVAASPSLPASCSSCWDSWTSHNCCLLNMFKVGTLLLHLSKLQKHFPRLIKLRADWWLKLTWWEKPLQNRSDARCPHSVWLYIVSGPPPPQ